MAPVRWPLSPVDPAGGLGRQALSAARTSYSASFQITMIAVGALCLVIGLAGAQVLNHPLSIDGQTHQPGHGDHRCERSVILAVGDH